MAPIDIGVFIPIGNNGWLISTTAPQYKPTFELNKQVVQIAEKYNLDFALSMIKLRGFGGPTEFWDYTLESFTLTAALAAVTSRITLFASAAVLALPPALAARMAATLDAVAPGRVGVNIVTGWQRAEYVRVLRALWRDGACSLRGAHFAMGVGVNTPAAFGAASARLVEAAARAGRDVGTYVLFMVIAEETDEAAQRKWKLYNDGIDLEALAWMKDQGAQDKTADANATATKLVQEGTVNLSMGTLIGSFEKVAAMLDEAAAVEGTKGLMLTFDDFVEGLEKFGQKIQPLMKSREGKM